MIHYIARTARPLAIAAGCLLATGALAQGPGASVDWKIGPDNVPAIFYDAPAGFDKHYRVCIQKPPAETQLDLILADRTIRIQREVCIDVVSNKISMQMVAGEEESSGIFYLVE